jgi:hypothetical protein
MGTPATISLGDRYSTLAGEELEELSLGAKQAAILLLPVER